MYIGGFVDTSLVDVPEHPVSVIFTTGCNFNCKYCHSSELLKFTNGKEMSVKEIIDIVKQYLPNGVCITGGEPTLQRDIINLVSELKNNGFYVNLNTNGSNPDVVKQLIHLGLDSIWLDIKTSKDTYPIVANVKNKCIWNSILQTIELALNSDTDIWVRTTLVRPLVSIADLHKIANMLIEVGYKGNWIIQNYVPSSGVRTEYKHELKSFDKSVIDNLSVIFSYLKVYGISIIPQWRK